mmetsp:Transcript_6104/g.15119  ORF Transcript_6104/g.15119 Transcript_6104/m.15119 type:complete len:90 (-) Transcript_6104:952-1221(-)
MKRKLQVVLHQSHFQYIGLDSTKKASNQHFVNTMDEIIFVESVDQMNVNYFSHNLRIATTDLSKQIYLVSFCGTSYHSLGLWQLIVKHR